MNTFNFEKHTLLSHIGNEEILNLFKKTNCIVAGGAITSIFSGKEINDVDVYFKDFESLKIVLQNLFNYNDMDEEHCFDLGSHSLIFTNMTKKSVLFTKNGLNIQLIYFKFFKDAKEIFDTFDFTINMGAYDCASETFVLHDNFLKDIAQRRLAVNPFTAFPIISLLRIDKYKQRGYKISRKDFINLCLAVNKLKLNSWEDLADAIGGMYGYTYTDLFNTKMLFTIDEAIDQLLKLEVNLEEYKSGTSSSDYYELIDKISINLKLVPQPDEKVFYKKVIRTNVLGTYTSYYYKTFEYKLGQTVEGTNKSGNNMGIWVYKSARKAKNHFASPDKTIEAILAVRALEGSQIINDGSGVFRILGKVEVI